MEVAATKTFSNPLAKLFYARFEITKLVLLSICSFIVWSTCQPQGLTDSSWKLLVIFISTIIGIVLKTLPMGALGILSLATLALTQTMPIERLFEGFSYDQIWLIVLACFLARGFIKTGLGKRIAYIFLSLFGGTPYGMGYGLLLSSTVMAPLIPSNTARTGGILLPVLQSVVQVLMGGKKRPLEEGDLPSQDSKIGGYLTLIVFHGAVITSAMFVTASAASPIVIKYAQNMGIELTWLLWAKAAFLPGVISLLVLPPFLLALCPCVVDDPKAVQNHAKQELHTMGKLSTNEIILVVVFSMLLGMWVFGKALHIHAVEATIFGVAILLLFNVLTWKDVLHEEMAWDTFVWMAALVMMASELQKQGAIGWFTNHVVQFIPFDSWEGTLLLLSFVYFYSHYFFASVTAHVSSMFGPFFAAALAAGAPPLASALLLGFLSSLYGGLTHYSSGAAPILFSQQHVSLKTWWKVGALSSILYLLLWVALGIVWWKCLGLW